MMFIPSLLSLIALVGRVVAQESVEEAAVLARRLVDSEDSIGTLATVFPDAHPTLAGEPFALMEYYASCYNNGSLALIFMPISQSSRNILGSANHSATITVRAHPAKAANARVALVGSVTVFEGGHSISEDNAEELAQCYLKRHPDARWWIPGRKPAPHLAYWARFDPHTVYYVGGFGNEHYIGYIPIELYGETDTEARGVGGRLLVQRQPSFDNRMG